MRDNTPLLTTPVVSCDRSNRFAAIQGTLLAADVSAVRRMTREDRAIGQRRAEVHPDIDPDGLIQAETLGLVVADQLDKDAGRSLHDTEDFDLGSFITPMVLAPPEPTDALELHVPVFSH